MIIFCSTTDHDIKTVALAITVIRWLENPEHPTVSPCPPDELTEVWLEFCSLNC